MSEYGQAIAAIADGYAEVLTRSLARRFGSMPSDRVEECVQDVLLAACSPDKNDWFVEGYAEGGDEELKRRLYTAGWRAVRGELRKVGSQRTDRMPTGYDAPDGRTSAEDRAATGALLSWLGRQVDEASELFGRTRQQTLQRALRSMVREGHQVKPLAARYRLPRRYLAEASVWIKRRLADRDTDE